MHPALHYLVGVGSGHGGAFIPPAAGSGADSSGAATSARLQILLVEDEAISALALKRLVSRLGHEICAMTAMAEDAIKLAGEMLPDVILMDIRLAGEMAEQEGGAWRIALPFGRSPATWGVGRSVGRLPGATCGSSRTSGRGNPYAGARRSSISPWKRRWTART